MSIARRSRWLGRAAVAAATLAFSSQTFAQAAPAAAKATEVTSVEGITEYALPNGLHVLLFPDQSKPTVTVNITYNVGSRHEGYGETGMAHLLEHLAFKGSKNHPEVVSEFTLHGARRNGTTWYDRTNYYETTPATDANLDWALDMEADRMVNSFIAKKDLESEFSVVRNELELGENSPFRVLIERVFRAAYRWHGYGRSTIGSRSDVEGVPIERLQAFYKKYYQPDNALLVVAGKFDPAKTLALIEKKFGSIPKPKRTLDAGNLLFPSYTVEPTQDGEQLITVRRVGDAQIVAAGYHIVAGAHPDFAATQVMARVLQDDNGADPSGRLYKALVDTKLAASVSAFAFQFRDPSLLMMVANLRMGQSLDSARAAMDAAIAAARTGTFSDAEVTRAKTGLLKDIELQLNNSDVVGLALTEWAAMGDWRLLFLHRDRLEKVTPADVQRIAQAYLKPDNRTTALFIPTPKPDRTDVAQAPSIPGMLAGYKGRAVVQAGEVFDASPKNIESRTKRSALPNGMQLQLLPKLTRGQKVNANLVLRHGTEQSMTNKGQIPSLTAAMLSRGTAALTRQQVQDSLDKLKAVVRIGGGGNNVNVTIETTRPNLIPALDLVAQQLKSPRFDADELEKLKKERVTGLESQKSEPIAIASIAYNKAIYPAPKGHPLYSSSIDETIADINAVTVADMKAFHQGFYGASYGDLAVVGDFDAAEVTAAARRLFGDWKNPQPFARIERKFFKTDSTFVSFETPDKANAFFLAGTTVAMSENDPDYPALFYGNYLLGGAGMASRLVDRLRQKEGISYSAGSGLGVQAVDKYGTWTANAILNPQNVDRLTRAFREEIDRVLKDGFTQEEIDKFKAGYLQARSQGRANDNELVGTLIARRFANRNLTWDEAYESKINALTAAEVNTAIKKYIDPKNIIIIRAGDFAKNPAPKPTP